MSNILITGCNRGLGLGLVKLFLKQDVPPKSIFATVRDESRAQELRAIAESNQALKIVYLDVTSFDSFPDFVATLEDTVADAGLNLIINNAGYAPKSTRLNFVKAEDMEHTFKINVTAPVMLTQALRPLLKSGAAYSGHPSWIVNMSSILGSVEANSDGAMYPYRASKCALNACTKSMSLDLKGDNIHAMSLHPGWVQTDMGGKNAPLKIEDACRDMVQLITHITPDMNGKFLQHDGKELPW